MSEAFRYKLQVASSLSEDFRSGGPKPDLGEFLEPVGRVIGIDGLPLQIDEELIRELIDHALDEKFPDHEAKDHIAQLDGWLATRLHFCLRIPRQLAADKGFWAWLAIDAGRRYIVHRWWKHNSLKENIIWRYTGDLLRNGLARLWWGAEMARNGPSYEYVEPMFRRVRTAQWALELKYSMYRPAPIAFIRVAEGLGGERRLSDNEMNALSVRINAYLSLSALECLGLDEGDDQRHKDIDWWTRTPTLREAVADSEIKGPKDGYAKEEAIGELEEWFRRLATEGGHRAA